MIDRTATGLDAQILRQIAQAITDLRYGAVHITVQDSREVQIEKVEKIRLTKPNADLTAGGAGGDPSRADRDAGGSRPTCAR